jgi:hypothetical protein
MSEPLAKDIRLLVEELAEDGGGAPAIVLVRDYAERQRLMESIREEAEIHGVELRSAATPDEAEAAVEAALPEQALAILVDAGRGEALGGCLDANREALARFRFVVALVIDAEFPKLARRAPAFLSWAKGNLVEKAVLDRGGGEDVTAELRSMEEATGLAPAEFLRRWERGEIKDTYETNLWAALARASIARGT